MTIRLNNLKNRPGARPRVKRYGCGESSGHGKTSGRGGKGQTARSGGSIRIGFEGGQMPLIRRLPKRGFNNAAFKKTFVVINVGDLNSVRAGTDLTPEKLVELGLIRKIGDGVKVLGGGKLEKKLAVRAHNFSATARAAIEAAGGTCEVIPNPRAPKTADTK